MRSTRFAWLTSRWKYRTESWRGQRAGVVSTLNPTTRRMFWCKCSCLYWRENNAKNNTVEIRGFRSISKWTCAPVRVILRCQRVKAIPVAHLSSTIKKIKSGTWSAPLAMDLVHAAVELSTHESAPTPTGSLIISSPTKPQLFNLFICILFSRNINYSRNWILTHFT